jgi:hypothetical protein
MLPNVSHCSRIMPQAVEAWKNPAPGVLHKVK